MKRKMNPEETRERIIRAAGEVFGRHGFDGTTIRQITKRAGVNVAAVNYHFRDKAELYLRVLREAKGLCSEIGVTEFPGAPEQQLRGFIFAFVRGLLDPARPAWHTQVITQEMMRPTPALDLLVSEMTEPIYSRLRMLVAAVAGTQLPGEKLDMLTSSILGQCLFYVRSRPMIERLAPELNHGESRIERIAEHITTFSLAALCHLYKRDKRNSSRTEPTARRSTAANRSRVPALSSS
ncbi:MAG TPA: CerR family C-terminal domain-containing protein [Candidatus Methylacidiphilales bacterium]|jgi:AcrR family transcriptional regulator|nr:CerR family C-terminal domain-containing protein [Candidatus Methylacidiphilales bacterium]